MAEENEWNESSPCIEEGDGQRKPTREIRPPSVFEKVHDFVGLDEMERKGSFLFHRVFPNGSKQQDQKLLNEAYEEDKAGAMSCPAITCLAVLFFGGVILSQVWPVANDLGIPSYLNENLIVNNKDYNEGTFTELDCENDTACKRIMDALTPVLSQDELEALQPDSCPWGARNWLRSNKCIMDFTPDRIRQRYALAVLYCATDGEIWLNNDGWMSDMHECDWFNGIGAGESCNRVEEITVLRLEELQLAGTLPPELSLLTSLHELTLKNNFLHGTIPDTYRTLSALDTLNLSFNLLHGTIPDYFFQFAEMTFLDLSQNDFSGNLPDELLKNMPNLEAFSAIGNKNLNGDTLVIMEEPKN